MFASLALQAQTFETRSTRYSGESILHQLDSLGTPKQKNLRDSVIAARTPTLTRNDTIETFFNEHHLGMVIYRNAMPHELLGFWDPEGHPVEGGALQNGTGVVKTPFNPALIQNFDHETVTYAGGMKNGAVFYYCDCASVLRRGTFASNQKTGLWEEFDSSGAFIQQTRLKLPPPPDGVDGNPDNIGIDVEFDIRIPAHCMMKRDDVCPDLKGGSK